MQTEELSYAIITPYSMRKSRTGGIIARLISRTGLDLVAARMFVPSDELIRRYAETIVSETEPTHRATQELVRAYVLKNFTGEKDGQAARVLFLAFRGTGAVDKMRATVGHISHEETSGETIRDTFGAYITDDSGKVTYFEPAVVAARDRAIRFRKNVTRPGRKNASRSFIRARMPSEKFAKCSAQPIRPKRRRAPSEKNSARPS